MVIINQYIFIGIPRKVSIITNSYQDMSQGYIIDIFLHLKNLVSSSKKTPLWSCVFSWDKISLDTKIITGANSLKSNSDSKIIVIITRLNSKFKRIQGRSSVFAGGNSPRLPFSTLYHWQYNLKPFMFLCYLVPNHPSPKNPPSS